MELYGDIFFIYNLIMDYIVLEITDTLWNCRGKRIFFWCVITNLFYIIFVCFFGLYRILPYIMLGLAVLLALKPDGIKRFAGCVITTYFISFLLGSISLGLMAVFNANCFVVILPSFLMLKLVKNFSDNAELHKVSGLYPLEVSVNDNKAFLTAFTDSGNALMHNDKFVIVADERALSPLLSQIEATFEIRCETVLGAANLKCFDAEIKINNKRVENACVGISTAPINGDFNALINPYLIKED